MVHSGNVCNARKWFVRRPRLAIQRVGKQIAANAMPRLHRETLSAVVIPGPTSYPSSSQRKNRLRGPKNSVRAALFESSSNNKSYNKSEIFCFSSIVTKAPPLSILCACVCVCFLTNLYFIIFHFHFIMLHIPDERFVFFICLLMIHTQLVAVPQI